ncbi:hypothetical protein GDO78_018911 [Eleutherodactylus coqui]|uniref:Uncharacterized protein n=1 Tax=Eleutherodactylus coqui TaxID=57060 RepID=A0A8J6EIW9_ELECQ|nr:hypothetical protein GDO78_018911 [Eleutherodactylus coqui]
MSESLRHSRSVHVLQDCDTVCLMDWDCFFIIRLLIVISSRRNGLTSGRYYINVAFCHVYFHCYDANL